MPKRTDIHKILIIGSGPIVIGQACEFDYSGTQACKALRQEGYQIVLLIRIRQRSLIQKPPTLPIEPLTVESLTEIIRREQPDALLPTVGGKQLYRNRAADAGVLEEYGVENDWRESYRDQCRRSTSI